MADDTLTAMAKRMGMTVSDLADASPWPEDAVARYAERHGKRGDPIGYQHLPDIQVASAVRMLMRENLDHEGVVCAARDRICALHVERAALLEALVLILPLAKGYAHAHRVGSNAAYVAAAEETVAKAEARP